MKKLDEQSDLDSDQDDDEDLFRKKAGISETKAEEQQRLKDEFKKKAKQEDSDSDDLFVKKDAGSELSDDDG